MANARNKTVDTTFLSLDHAENRGFLHRDYLAHCLRWSHVVRYLMQNHRYQTQHVLDVGCGREAPLAKLMFSSRMTHTTGSYTGVDYGPLEWPSTIAQTGKFRGKFLAKFDFAKTLTNGQLPPKFFDTVVCFEMLEHVEPFHSYETLKAICRALKADGVAFVSTPCYDPKMGPAANHVNEMTYQALNALIWLAGLDVIETHGTFASQKDYKHLLKPNGLDKVFDLLSQYYDSNVVACLFAPLFPEQARNCLWRLKVRGSVKIDSDLLNAVDQPASSSSAEWQAQLEQAVKAARKEAKKP